MPLTRNADAGAATQTNGLGRLDGVSDVVVTANLEGAPAPRALENSARKLDALTFGVGRAVTVTTMVATPAVAMIIRIGRNGVGCSQRCPNAEQAGDKCDMFAIDGFHNLETPLYDLIDANSVPLFVK